MTKIEWCDETWNPITGCSPISIGCENCYAKRMANRLRGRFGYPADDPFRVTFHPDRLEQLRKWRKPRRIFVCSMGDLFHDDVPLHWLDDIFQVIAESIHTFIVLTKRPANMKNYCRIYVQEEIVLPDNFWLGVTAENQERLIERWKILRQIPAAVRFVSVEPMLEPVNLDKTCTQRQCWRAEIDWVIVGAETGPGARPMKLKWARDLRDQCKVAGVPFFFKSAGKQPIPDDLMIREFPGV